MKPLLGAAPLLLAACTTSPWHPDRFAPAPLEARVASEHDAGAQARVLVSVLGLVREDDSAHLRILVENAGQRTLRLVPDALALVTADLASFGPARVSPEPAPVLPGAQATHDAVFACPAGRSHADLDLQGLNLRLTLDFEGRAVTTGLSFHRIAIVGDYDSEPRVNVGIGVGWTHVH